MAFAPDSEFLKYADVIENKHIKDFIKNGGNGVIGFYCANLPEELVHRFVYEDTAYLVTKGYNLFWFYKI